jgi:hypothetical protein
MVADCGFFGQSRHIGRRWSMEWHGHCLCNERPSPWAIPPLGAAFVGGLLYLAMTPNDFRRLALSRPEAVEVFRKGRSDFRVRRKSFASLKGHADSAATVQLTPEQQAMFMHAAPGTFVPVPGGWGRLGATNVMLQHAEEATVESALIHAWRNVAPKALLESTDEP